MSRLSVVRIPITIQSCGQNLVGVYHPACSLASVVPLVIMCHGLGGDKCGKGRISVSLSEKLSSVGIASFRFDFFGSGDSEGTFSDLTPRICIQNLVDVVAIAQKDAFGFHHIAFGSIGLFGRSFGGYICVLASLMIKSLKAIVIQSPPFDVEAFSSLPPYFHVENGVFFFMGEPISADFISEIQNFDISAALEHITSVPLLHISCEKDRIINSDHTLKFKKARRASQAPTCFDHILDADHECSLYRHRILVMQKVAAWFVDFLSI